MSAGLDSISFSRLSRGSVENAFDDAREIGHFSVDARRQIHYDRSMMRYYIPRGRTNPFLNLNVGYTSSPVREAYNCEEKMEQMLRWIAHERFQPLKSDVDFVTIRSSVQKLLCTPYCSGSSDHWIICACRLNGIIYVEACDTDEKILRERNASEEEMRMSAWGYKFEQYMTADRPNGVPDMSSTTFDKEQFYVVAANKIGKHKLLIRAEVDGAKASFGYYGESNPSLYVEMKTSKIAPDFKRSYNFQRYKSLKWWAQSVIIGIKENICGLRDDYGIVQSIETFQTDEFPICGQAFWSRSVCFSFCNNFLDYLKEILVQNDHRIVYKFQYSGGQDILISKLYNPRGRYQVIPDWYLSEMQNYRH